MSGDLIGPLVRLLLALPVVLGLAYLVLKYGLSRRYVVATGRRRMKLVEQLPLGPKTSLSLVALGGRYYLLAHLDSSIRLIKELEELPDQNETKIGDIVELTPQTIEEYDQLQKSKTTGKAGCFSGFRRDISGLRLKRAAAQAARVKEILLSRLSAGNHAGKKGEKS